MNNEQLADYYKKKSGKIFHTSDCNTSVAPAEKPGACNCVCPKCNDTGNREIFANKGEFVTCGCKFEHTHDYCKHGNKFSDECRLCNELDQE